MLRLLIHGSVITKSQTSLHLAEVLHIVGGTDLNNNPLSCWALILWVSLDPFGASISKGLHFPTSRKQKTLHSHPLFMDSQSREWVQMFSLHIPSSLEGNLPLFFFRYLWSACTCLCMLCRFSLVWLFAILRTIAHQAPLPMGFFRQEDWSGLPALLQHICLTQGSNTCVYISCISWQVVYH